MSLQPGLAGHAQEIAMVRVNGRSGHADRDALTVEEPLEIRVRYAEGAGARAALRAPQAHAAEGSDASQAAARLVGPAATAPPMAEAESVAGAVAAAGAVTAAEPKQSAGGLAAPAAGAVAAAEPKQSAGGLAAPAIAEPVEPVEPVEPAAEHSVAVTMRTPGDDYELAAGFLFSEGFIDHPEQLADVSYCGREGNVVRATLVGVAPRAGARGVDAQGRALVASASCGVCGKASIEEVMATIPARPATVRTGTPTVEAQTLHRLPAELRRRQATFDRTGGLHAAALFDAGGRLLRVHEDVGRHNALDKLIGRAVLEATLPLDDAVVLFSGRTGFELVQKAARAGVRFLAAVGAPSSLACDLAERLDITLIGFLRDRRFNIYCGAQRVRGVIGNVTQFDRVPGPAAAAVAEPATIAADDSVRTESRTAP